MRIPHFAILATVATLGVQTLAAQSMPTYWRLAVPDAKLLAGVDVQALKSAMAATDWKGQLQQAAGGAVPLDLMNSLEDGGVLGKTFQGVNRIFVSLSEIPKDTSKPKMAVALVGEFDLAALRKYMVGQGGVKSIYRGVEVWQSKGQDNVMIALASPQVLAVGDKASVRQAVSQYAVGNGAVMGSAVYQRATALAQTNDIWIAGEMPVGAETNGGAVANPMAAQFLKSVESFDLGLRIKAGLDMEMNLYAPTAESATGLAAGLQTLAQLAAANADNPQATDFLARLKMGTEGERVQMSASWTAGELAETMRAASKGLTAGAKPGAKGKAPMLASNRGDATAGRGPSAIAMHEEPKPKAPLKVRIYNPDDTAVKEVELVHD